MDEQRILDLENRVKFLETFDDYRNDVQMQVIRDFKERLDVLDALELEKRLDDLESEIEYLVNEFETLMGKGAE